MIKKSQISYSNRVQKYKRDYIPIGNLPSAVILIKATSAGVPTNAPTQPAVMPSAAFVIKLGWLSFLNKKHVYFLTHITCQYNSYVSVPVALTKQFP